MTDSASIDLIVIRNHHVPSCGKLPAWARNRGDDSYFTYFENSLSEQWMLYATVDSIELAGGDLGWERIRRVDRPDWHRVESWTSILQDDDALPGTWPGLILEPTELEWLRAAVRTASQRFKRRTPPPSR